MTPNMTLATALSVLSLCAPLAAQPQLSAPRTLAAQAGQIALAYDEPNDRFLVAYTSAAGVKGTLVQADGSIAAGPFPISTRNARDVAVGNVAARGAFVAVYPRGIPSALYGVVIDAATGAVSPEILVDSTEGFALFEPALSDATTGLDALTLAYTRRDNAACFVNCLSIGAARLAVSAALRLQVVRRAVIGHDISRPRLAESTVAAGTVVMSYTGYSTISTTVHASFQTVDATLTGTGATWLHSIADNLSTGIGGDGSSWHVAVGTAFDLRGYRLDSGGQAPVLGTGGVLVSGVTSAVQPVVLGQSALVFHQTLSSGRSELWLRSRTPTGCGACEAPRLVAADSPGFAVAARRRNGRPADRALLAWRVAATLQSAVVNVADGAVTDLGGGCGAGARAFVGCARPGNACFVHEVRGAPPRSLAWLAIGSRPALLSCGPCQLRVDPVGAALLWTRIDTRGQGRQTTPLPASPALVGARFVEQWLVFEPSGCAPYGVALSNALDTTIQ